MLFFGLIWLEIKRLLREDASHNPSLPMIELKVQCDCGQKFKFEVEPINNLMPFTVNCPICGADGTSKANGMLADQVVAPPMMATAGAPAAVAAPAALRISAAAPPVVAAPPRMAPAAAPARPVMRPGMAAAYPAVKDSSGPTNLGLGFLGALIGAGVGAGLMYGFFALTDIRFPWLGTGVGALTGLGARLLFKGKDSSLGAISAGVAAVAVIGTLFAMYGEFPIIRIISVIVSISIAYKVAS